MHVAAESEKLAEAICLRKELQLVEFSLLPKEPVAPVEPDGKDGLVLVQYINAQETYARAVEEYPNRRKAAVAALSELTKHHAVDGDGKAHGPTKRGRGHLHAHMQAEPYRIASIDKVVPDVERLVHAVLKLQENEQAWARALAELRKGGVPLAAVTASLFGLQAQKNIDGSAPVVWTTATLKVALTTSAWTPNQDTHDFFDDVTNEITGTGYTAGGATLGTKTTTYDTATDQVRADAADTLWTTSTLTARRAPIYSDTGGAASTDPVIAWVDFGADVSTTAGTFQITWDATGILNYDVS